MSNSAQDEFDALCHRQRQTSNCHPEDVSACSSDDSTTLHSDNDDDQVLTSKHEPDMPSATYHIPTTNNFNANTGPKGVIADARSFESAKKRGLRQTLQSLSNGQSPPRSYKHKKPFDFSREKTASPDNSADDDEDEFMRRWRANRLDELANISQDLRTRRQSPSQRKYGTLVTVDPSGYLDAVEKVPADTIVVVLIYDDEVCTCEDRSSTLALTTAPPQVDYKRCCRRCSADDCP